MRCYGCGTRLCVSTRVSNELTRREKEYKRCLKDSLCVSRCASLDYQKDAGKLKFMCRIVINWRINLMQYCVEKQKPSRTVTSVVQIYQMYYVFSWFLTIFKCLERMQKPEGNCKFEIYFLGLRFLRSNPNDTIPKSWNPIFARMEIQNFWCMGS